MKKEKLGGSVQAEFRCMNRDLLMNDFEYMEFRIPY